MLSLRALRERFAIARQKEDETAMTTLYLNAPEWRADREDCKSFQDILKTAVGTG